MKSGKVLIPFVDYKNGKPYQVNDKFTCNKKRFEELLKAGLISDGKDIDEESTDLEDTENQETNEEIDVDLEDTENEVDEESTDLEDTEE